MSWSVGLSLGESFAEFSAFKGRQKIQTRWYIPKLSIVDGLEKIFEQNPDLKGSSIFVTTKTAQLIMRHRAGSQIALLVTSGFEEWPYIRQPVKDQSFTLNPRRHKPLLSQDLIFGITERTSASGEILTPLRTEDLEFLIPKLQLMETKQVAVGFLHSSKNPAHEKMAAELLRAQGFEVLCSHEIEETNNEVARWWRAVLNAYVAPAFHELETQLSPLKEKHYVQFHFVSSDGSVFEGNARCYYSSAFGSIAALAKLPKQKRTKAILHFGLEQFLFIQPQSNQPIWQSDFGPVALPAPKFSKLKIQPTQMIENNSLAGAHFSASETGFESGPMLLGRTIRPTVIDILYSPKEWTTISGLKEWIADSAPGKIEQTLHTLFKGLFEDANDIRPSLRDLALSLLAQEISQLAHTIEDHTQDLHFLCTGPLAPVFAPALSEKLPNYSFQVEKNPEFSESLSAALIQASESPTEGM